jgi:hypothetical protein
MQRLIQFLFLLLIGLMIGLNNLKILSQEYPGFLSSLPIEISPDNKLYVFVFKAGKILSFIALLGYLFILIDFYGPKRHQITRRLEGLCQTIYKTIKANYDFIIHYHKCLKIAFILLAFILLFFLFNVPYHYDEAFSYRYFTGVGWLRTITFYPLPNNHIFYNVIAGLFTALPLDSEITTRLPSLIAALIAALYFLKLCSLYFSKPLSLFLAFLFATVSPVILYAVLARGYGFLACFAVLQLYAANNLINNYNSSRYKFLYYFSFVAGLYSIPSYLYFVFPVHLLLFLCLIARNKFPWKYFMIDNTIALASLVILYGIVIYFNSANAVFKPNGTPRMEYVELKTAVWAHLNSTWLWLTNIKLPYLKAIAILTLAPLAHILINKKATWLALVTPLLIISPIGILFLHRVIPFERTWIYLIIPIILSLGFAIDIILQLVKKWASDISSKSWLTGITSIAVCSIMLINFSNFRHPNPQEYALDLNIRETLKKINPEISMASTMYMTWETHEFYIAEQILYVRQKNNPQRPLTVNYEKPSFEEDIIIINPQKGIKEMPQLANYRLTGYFNDYYALYLKK